MLCSPLGLGPLAARLLVLGTWYPYLAPQGAACLKPTLPTRPPRRPASSTPPPRAATPTTTGPLIEEIDAESEASSEGTAANVLLASAEYEPYGGGAAAAMEREEPTQLDLLTTSIANLVRGAGQGSLQLIVGGRLYLATDSRGSLGRQLGGRTTTACPRAALHRDTHAAACTCAAC